MIAIILNADDVQRKKALELGFKEQKVLVREECRNDITKESTESEIMNEITPFRFVVCESTWGVGPE